MFSDLIKDAEAAVGKLLPRDGAHDTREADALAKVADGLDPSLAPLFDALGAAGDAVEAEFANLAAHVRELRAELVRRQEAPPVAAPPQTAYPTEPVVTDSPADLTTETMTPPAGDAVEAEFDVPVGTPDPAVVDPTAWPSDVTPPVAAPPSPTPPLAPSETTEPSVPASATTSEVTPPVV